MKKIILYTAALSMSFMMASCNEDITHVDIPAHTTDIDVTYEGVSIINAEFKVEFEKSKTADFTSQGMSYVEAVAPEGWDITTSMDNNELIVKAPKYTDGTAEKTGTVTLKAYDGKGGFIEKHFTVTGFECETKFVVESASGLQTFSLASRKFYKYSKSANLTSFNTSVPKGWTVETQDDGFYVTAPIWTPQSGLDQDGTISITPVSFTGKACDDLKADMSVHVNENATFQFANPGKVTFSPGEAKEIEMVIAGMKSIDQVIAPKGWVIDYANLLETQKFKVTAPVEGGDIETYGSIKIIGTQAGIEKSVTSEGVQILRFRGLNNIQDFVDFRAAHGAEATKAPDSKDVEDYVVDGELKFYQDITLTSKDMYQGTNPGQFFMHNLFIPINGNGHTLAIDIATNGGASSLFNTLSASIHDLNISGSLSCSGSTSVAVLAQINGASIEITRVNSSVTITLNGGDNVLVGGFFEKGGSNMALNIDNCKVSGNIICNATIQRCGGLLSTGTADKKGGTGKVSLNKCEFSGNIVFNKDNTVSKYNNNARFGGMFGSQERNGEMIDCLFSGNIYLYLHGIQLFKSTGGGVGGMMGRCNALTSGYTMNTVMKNCISSGKIHIMNRHASEFVDNYQMLVGVNLGTCTPENCTVSGAVVFDE